MNKTASLIEALSLGNQNGNRNEMTLADLAYRYRRNGRLTEKQVAFALKLASELQNPIPRAIAPLGKGITFDGTVTSVKKRSAFRSDEPALKMTVTVDTPNGSWLAWGTLPAALYARRDAGAPLTTGEHTDAHLEAMRGRRVRVKATLKAAEPRDGTAPDPGFAIMVRPSAEFLDNAHESECDAADTVRMAPMAVPVF